MTNYRRGRAAEWEMRRILENSGWRVMRSAASRGPVDLVAFNKLGRVRMIQCKLHNDNKSFLKELKELEDMSVLYPHFSWELWVKKSGGVFARLS